MGNLRIKNILGEPITVSNIIDDVINESRNNMMKFGTTKTENGVNDETELEDDTFTSLTSEITFVESFK